MSASDTDTYSRNYRAYACAQGRTPDEQMEHDRAAWPGGCMTGFILWISKMQSAFNAAHPEAMLDAYTIGDLAAWAQFLDAQSGMMSQTC